MSVNKRIEEQLAELQNLRERFEREIDAETFEKRVATVADAQEARIRRRIERLGEQKRAAVARYDSAIKREEAALKAVQAQRVETGRRPGRPRGTKTGGGKGGRPRSQAKKS